MYTTIRSSNLPHYSDCQRRAAAKMLAGELRVEHGFEFAVMRTSIGAVVGTATHRALEHAIILRSVGKDYTGDKLKEIAAESIATSITGGVIWDDTTRKKDDAIAQAVRQAKAVINILPEIEGIQTEEEFTANLGNGFILSGHIDIRGSGEIWDLKTGTQRRANQGQYGAYSLLCRSNGLHVSRVGEIYIKRVGITKPQPEPIVVEFNIPEIEAIAYQTILRIKRDITDFRETKDPWVWLPNPNSMMCTPDYCPAFNTNFCNCHKKTKKQEENP